MGIEIERKFLVASEGWREGVVRVARFRQGYLCLDGPASVRVRVSDSEAFINIKSGVAGMVRDEFEYPVPLEEARQMLERLCVRPLIEKTRHWVRAADQTWEVDVFAGDNAGLVVAEIELESEDQPLERPVWLGEEVTHDRRYYNVALVRHPYIEWGKRRP
ncbi:MAG: CYTH domain-containing protein [Gammaproteobacteria bacterium]|jgi:adenylate cyclase